jgi:hypothetical protein
MKLVASLIAGILLGAASVAVAAPLNWKKSGERYVCTGGPKNVSCIDASPGGLGPLNIGNYEVSIEGPWVSVKYAERVQNRVPVDQKTILRCYRRDPGPARNCTYSP